MVDEELVNKLLSEMNATADTAHPRRDDILIEKRICESDKYDGVEMTIKGQTVHVQPFLKKVGLLNDWKIESMTMVSDTVNNCPQCGEEVFEKSLKLFCAYVGESTENSNISLADVFV